MTAEDIQHAVENAPEVKISDADEIARLAELPLLEYDREREKAAKNLGVRVGTLDEMVKVARGKDGAISGQGQTLSLPEPEPWPEPVDGDALMKSLIEIILRYVVLPRNEAVAVALWVIHAHIFYLFIITPRLTITSPEKGCGKTTLLDVLYQLTPRPLLAASVTPAVVFRIIEKTNPTLLIDEGDASVKDNEDLRGILNSGHRKGGCAIRTVGDDHEVKKFATFSPLVIALIGKLHDTLLDRSIVISLRRRLPDEPITQFRADRTDELQEAARKVARWAEDNRTLIAQSDPEVPTGLFNRVADNWRPLLAIADTLGGDWPQIARSVAVALTTQADAENTSYGTLLLADIRSIFDDRREDRIHSEQLTTILKGMEERPWAEWHGKGISANSLARMLRPFQVTPTTLRIGDGKPLKGYKREQFADAWQRYLPAIDTNATVTTLQGLQTEGIEPKW